MKRFTKMFLTLALLCVAGSANAVTEEVVHECDYSTKSSYPWYVMGKPNNADFYVSDGVLVVTNPVEQTNNWDLQPFIDDNITAEEGCNYIIRLTYKTTVAGNITLNMGTWSSGKSADVALTVSDDFQTVDGALNDYNTSASNIHILLQMGKLIGTVYVQKVQLIYLVPDDPLLKPKQDLQNAIAIAEKHTSFAKTEDSFAPLADAITAAKQALEASDATVESLAAAENAINDVYKGYVLLDGYTELTAAMFMSHKEQGGEGSATGCAYDINKSTGMPYGDGNVNWLNYADLSSYDKLYVTVATGTPRFCMNRIVDGAQASDDPATSNFIDIPNKAWAAEAYQTKEGDNIFVINLAKMVADRGIAYLHSMKSVGGNVTITGMYLYKAADPLESYKEALQAAITKGKAVNAFGKTEDSFSALTSAISAGEGALESATSAKELEDAKQAIENAISGLTIADGYTVLTQEMFKKWTAADATAEESGTPNFESNLGAGINAGATLYGDGSVFWHNFADLSDYGMIYFVGNPGVQVRCLFNRAEDPDNKGALVEKVITVNEEGVAEFDLTTLTEGYAHLNSVKIPWNGSTGNIITDILLTELTTVPVTVGAAGYATFSSKKAVDFTGSNIKAYTATVSGKDITFIRIYQVPANTGVLLWAEGGADENVTIIESADAVENNLVVATSAMDAEALAGKYILGVVDEVAGFYKAGQSASLAAGKAYLEAPEGARIILPGNEATGINAVEAAENAEAIYNLQGQRVVKAAKGINIKGGKKFIVR